MGRGRRRAQRWTDVLTGAGLGAGLMFLLDPAGARGARAVRQAGAGARRLAGAAARSFRSQDAPGTFDEALGAEVTELLDEDWPQSTRCLAASAGGGLLAWAVRRGDGLGLAVGAGGAALLARAATNRPLLRAAHLTSGPRLVEVHKTIAIEAPIDLVYGLWTRYEAFPRFMSNLKEVEDLGQGRSRWTVSGPAGVPVTWQAEVTRIVPEQTLAWRSLPGSAVANAGVVEFAPLPEGGTRVDIRLSYHPPAGTLGLLAARLFGGDAQTRMDEDLRSLKASLEAATPARGGAVPDEVVPVS